MCMCYVAAPATLISSPTNFTVVKDAQRNVSIICAAEPTQGNTLSVLARQGLAAKAQVVSSTDGPSYARFVSSMTVAAVSVALEEVNFDGPDTFIEIECRSSQSTSLVSQLHYVTVLGRISSQTVVLFLSVKATHKQPSFLKRLQWERMYQILIFVPTSENDLLAELNCELQVVYFKVVKQAHSFAQISKKFHLPKLGWNAVPGHDLNVLWHNWRSKQSQMALLKDLKYLPRPPCKTIKAFTTTCRVPVDFCYGLSGQSLSTRWLTKLLAQSQLGPPECTLTYAATVCAMHGSSLCTVSVKCGSIVLYLCCFQNPAVQTRTGHWTVRQHQGPTSGQQADRLCRPEKVSLCRRTLSPVCFTCQHSEVLSQNDLLRLLVVTLPYSQHPNSSVLNVPCSEDKG